MNNKERIIELNKLRYELINKNNVNKASNKEVKLIDEYAAEISKLLKENFERLEFDFILEQEANLGGCPCLLNDDNGHWAVTGDGYQNVVMGEEPEDVDTRFFVKAEDWRNTPRKALEHFLFDDELDIDFDGGLDIPN